MIPQKHKDFLEALRRHDLAAEARLYGILSMLEPMRVAFGGIGRRITRPGVPYCPKCGADLGEYFEEMDHCPDCGQALDWTEEQEG